ncbi:MAG: hypothetical protein HYU28_01125 [Actinobacteria bacterium]|nr:hypothetical protein [Actinomycetota bacterium]
MFVDPGAKELIDKLTIRVATLERQIEGLIERLGVDATPIGAVDSGSGTDDETLALVREGKTADAINAYRAATGAGLGEAKDHVDRLKSEHGL